MAYRPKTQGAAGITDLIRSAGVAQPGAVLDVRSVVGPASYSAGGIPVDLSAAYASIIDVSIPRIFTTANSNSVLTMTATINQTGTDLFTSAKFRVALIIGGTHTPAGTVAAPTLNLANGEPTNVTVTTPASNGSALAGGLAGGAGALTGLTGIQAPAFTGTATGGVFHQERSAGGNESTRTFQFWVLAVPR